MTIRLPVRTRLTFLYGALFLACGVLLVGAMVLLVRDSLFAPLPNELLDAAKLNATGQFDKVAFIDQVRAELQAQAEARLFTGATAALAALTVIAGGIGWLFAGRMLSRVRRVTEAAQAASDTSLNRRLNLPGPEDELKELGDTFDAMLARLDDAFAAQRRFVANASHELRTPLSVGRTAVEVTLAKPAASGDQLRTMAEEVLVALDRAQQLIDALLLLARSQLQIESAEPDDLADIGAEALDTLRSQVTARRLTLTTSLDPAPIRGDLTLLTSAVVNLVENACRYANDGGTVSVAAGHDAMSAWIVIANSGSDLTAIDLERLFEPFHRGGQTRLTGDGAGLGLSIARSVAVAHGGEIVAAARSATVGGGLRIELRLPVAT
jgi:hypothetical protein